MSTFWLILAIAAIVGSLLMLIGGAVYAWLEISGRTDSQFRIDAERERASYAIHQQMMQGLNEMLETARGHRTDPDRRSQR